MRRPARKGSRLKLYLLTWWVTILLVACQIQPVRPEAQVTADGESGEAVSTPASALATPTPTSAVTTTTPASAASVAILVVDFFDLEDERTGGGTNCLATPNGVTSATEGAGSHGSTGAGDKLVSTDVPHGELVYTHLRQQFDDGVGFSLITSGGDTSGLGIVEVTDVNYAGVYLGNVYLAQIDIGDNFTDAVFDQIVQARDWLRGQGVDYFVVNMSVVVKPCAPIFDESEPAEELGEYGRFLQCIPALSALQLFLNQQDYPAAEANAILRARAELAAAYFIDPVTRKPYPCPEATTLGNVLERSQAFISQLPEDILYRATESEAGSDTFYVAASGNDGRSFPYAPAIFRFVVSTGTDVATAEASIGYRPNRAEWILNDRFDWVVPEGKTAKVGLEEVPEFTPIAMRGTSFATPKLSYLTALALLEGPMPACYPEMIYAANVLPANWDDWPDPVIGVAAMGLTNEDVWQNRYAGELGPICGFPAPSRTTPPS